MRTLLLSACLSFLSAMLLAQVPQAIKYQAVARDSAGSILANANITLRISILDSAAGGSVAYSEIHKTGTNQFGLFSISIGRGIQPNGSFANIDWATGSKWMQLEMSQNDGATFTLIGASEMLSVPYALYAETSNTQVNSTAFNPLYPDGTDDMEGVTFLLTDSTAYVVPAGKNFYLIHWRNSAGGGNPKINGIEFQGNDINQHPFLILGPGDTISRYSTAALQIYGYLVKQRVIAVNTNLNNGTFVVPAGKRFFLTFCPAPKDPVTPKILVNGMGFTGNDILPDFPIILNAGDSISVSPIPTFPSYLNGYLK